MWSQRHRRRAIGEGSPTFHPPVWTVEFRFRLIHPAGNLMFCGFLNGIYFGNGQGGKGEDPLGSKSCDGIDPQSSESSCGWIVLSAVRWVAYPFGWCAASKPTDSVVFPRYERTAGHLQSAVCWSFGESKQMAQCRHVSSVNELKSAVGSRMSSVARIDTGSQSADSTHLRWFVELLMCHRDGPMIGSSAILPASGT